jgi:hypothetical protein
MTINVSNTAQTNTFEYWRNRTNELARAMSTYTVTTESNTAAGNAAISGVFTASGFQISNGSGTWVLGPPVVNNVFIVGTSNSTIIDSFAMNTYAGAEYIMTAVDADDNSAHMTKIMVTHNKSSSYMNEFGTIYTNTSLGSVNASTNSTHVIISFIADSANVTVNFARTVF